MKIAWKEKEKRDAKRFNGKTQPGSGNQWGHKGDVKAEQFLVENKTTIHKTFPLGPAIWEKIRVKAINTPGVKTRIPMLSIEFLPIGLELVCLDINDFQALIDSSNKPTPPSYP